MSIKPGSANTIMGDVRCGPEAVPCPWCKKRPMVSDSDGKHFIGCEQLECHARPFVTGSSAASTLLAWNACAPVDLAEVR